MNWNTSLYYTIQTLKIKRKNKGKNFRDSWNLENIPNIYITGVPERIQKEWISNSVRRDKSQEFLKKTYYIHQCTNSRSFENTKVNKYENKKQKPKMKQN